jgi:hypothetical protein
MIRLKKNNGRAMTRLERAEYKKLKSSQKAAQAIKKKVATSLRWMDLQEVKDDCMIVGKDKKYIVRGIKLDPHDIFIDDEGRQQAILNNIRLALNQMPDEVWFEFPYSPVNADNWTNELNRELRTEKDLVITRMIEADMEKIYDFQKYHREKEFFLLIRDTDEKQLHKNLEDLYRHWANAGFNPKVLNKRDYYSLVSFYFENSLINDYTFSRGIFSYLNVQMQLNQQKDEYEKVDHTEDFSKYGDYPILNIKPSENLIQRSKIAPVGLRILNRHIEVGDKYIQNLLVTELPDVFNLGLMCDYLTDPSIKVFMKAKRSNDDLTKMLNKDLRVLKERYKKTKDEIEREKILTEIESQEIYISEVVRKADRTHDLTVIFQIVADDEKELKDKFDRLRSRLALSKFKVSTAPMIQEQLFKMATPLFVSSGLNQTIEENIGSPLTSDAIAGMYPFVFETLNDLYGFLLGEERANGGKIFLDPQFYLHQPKQAAITNRLNGNFVIVGTAGSGKTTLTALVIRWLIRKRIFTIWVDPENKNEILTKRYNGTYVSWGQLGNVINIFDLKPNSSDEGEDDSAMWNTGLAINRVIEDVTILFKFLFPQMEEDALSFIGGIVKMTYAEVGIKADENGMWKSFKDLTTEDMPTFETFNTCLLRVLKSYQKMGSGHIEDVKLLSSLVRKMQRILTEWSVYFVGHTTIKLKDDGRNIISFGTKELFNADQELKNALYYLMFNYSWSLCLDENVESAFIVDEAHDVIQTSHTAKMVAQFVRRSRKYKNLMFLITQEPQDFAVDAVIMHTRAMFNNSAYKIVMKLNKAAAEGFEKLESVNENEMYWVKHIFSQGDALLLIGDQRRIPIHVNATQNELWEMGAMFTGK